MTMFYCRLGASFVFCHLNKMVSLNTDRKNAALIIPMWPAKIYPVTLVTFVLVYPHAESSSNHI